jgi:sterol desaturase/sphingolipid hydroxylase (fatty acid hydroxylase superfamily)
MGLLTLEHSRIAYCGDFAFYGAAAAILAIVVNADAADGQQLASAALVLAGLASWTAIEYALHRFVLHGLPPFNRWHAEHHRRPTALIGAPTILSSTLILVLVFVPALLIAGWLYACAFTLGVVTGYLGYAITHHATHHWHSRSTWLKRRKRWHALHHHHVDAPGCYGVTSALWDHVFGSAHWERAKTAE